MSSKENKDNQTQNKTKRKKKKERKTMGPGTTHSALRANK